MTEWAAAGAVGAPHAAGRLQVPSMPLTQLSWTDSVQRDSVRPGQHAWGWNWGWNPALRGFKVRVPRPAPRAPRAEAAGVIVALVPSFVPCTQAVALGGFRT